jgi:hypothetical protein
MSQVSYVVTTLPISQGVLLFPYLCKFPVACKSQKLILDHHFLDILSTSKNYCMFFNIASERWEVPVFKSV